MVTLPAFATAVSADCNVMPPLCANTEVPDKSERLPVLEISASPDAS